MSEIMLHGVLNMPAELWDSSNPFDSMQRQSRYFEASRLIYHQADRIEELEKNAKGLQLALSFFANNEASKDRDKIADLERTIESLNYTLQSYEQEQK
tara:strand:+ start:208 stop:501 length:294 start_codon:yes stop_codon:yes gene_type:complete